LRKRKAANINNLNHAMYCAVGRMHAVRLVFAAESTEERTLAVRGKIDACHDRKCVVVRRPEKQQDDGNECNR
jgi:hypothetical protein